MLLEAVKTTVSTEDMALAFHAAYVRFFGDVPKDGTIKILLSHWALETGWGKSMWCYNVGNCKGVPNSDQYDCCYFACNEIMSTIRAKRMHEMSPGKTKITRDRSNGTSVIWFYPKHRWSCFRAFRTLEDGVYDHLKLIVNRFNKAWPFIYQGDPSGYAKALKEQNYYTADEATYTRTLVKVFHMFDRIELPVKIDLSDEDKMAVRASVSASLRDMREERIKDAHQLTEED